jgi:hypothetical protein
VSGIYLFPDNNGLTLLYSGAAASSCILDKDHFGARDEFSVVLRNRFEFQVSHGATP